MSVYGETVEFWKDVHSAVIDRIKEMTERDVKDYDQSTKKNLISSLIDLRKTLKIDDAIIVRQLELEMSLKLLTSNYLEKRIRGLNEIKEAIDDAIKYRTQSYYWGVQKNQYLELNQILDWLLEKKVLEVLTGEHAHAELLKRSVDLFEMMTKKRKWTPEHLKVLWESIEGKHESYVRCAFDIVSRMPTCLQTADINSLFETITRAPSDQDEKYLTLLKNFSSAAINSESRRGSQTEDYGVRILYALAIDEGNEFAATCLTELFSESRDRFKKEIYAEKAMMQFLSGNAVPQSLNLVLSLLETMPEFDQGDFIKAINKKQQAALVILVANSICKYMETARKMEIREDVQTTEKCLHSKHLGLRFRLLTLLTRRSQRIDAVTVETLWRTMVVAPALDTDSSRMFAWLSEAVVNKALDSSVVLGYFINPQMFDISKASLESFEAYRGMFLSDNKAGQKLDVRGQVIAKRLEEDLRGFDAALNFAIDSSNERVNNAAVTLITECMLLIDYRVSTASVWSKFTTWMIRLLQEKNSHRVIRGLKLCHALIDPKVEIGSYPSSAPRVTFHVSTPAKQFPEKVTVPNDAPLGYLRKRIAGLLKTHPSKVVLRGYRTLELSEDDQAVYKVLPHIVYINAEVNKAAMEDVKANELLATSEAMYDSLFSLAAEPSTSELAWELLMKLPTSKVLKRQLEQINKPAFEPHQSFHKRLYSLIVIAELCQSANYAERFLSTKEGQHLIKDVFETKILSLECSGLLIVKFTEVVCQLVTKLVKRRLNVLQTRVVLHQSVNYLYCISQKLVKGCEVAVGEVKKLLEACFVEAELNLYTACFATHTKLKEVLLQMLVRADLLEIRNSMYDFVIFFSNPPFSLSQIFLQKLLELLLIALKEPTSLSYFSTVSKLVRISGQSFASVLDENRKQLMNSLALRSENSSHEPDEGLIGGLRLVRSIIKTLRLECQPEELEFVMKDCLLNMSPLCKHQSTRKHALKLLGKMIAHSPISLSNLLPQISALYIDPSWRTGRNADWEISSDTGEKSSAGFVGIRNTGCICYMISVLQQLFMVRSFRSQVLGLDVSLHEQVSDNILYVCQRIFAGLSYSTKQYIGIRRLCEALKDSRAVNVNEQMDVEEFLNAFMDKLEGRLGPNRSTIGNHFGGQIATEIIGKQACTHTSERVEQFLTLPLEVKTKKSLIESLESLVLGETLEGDNAYQCDQCGARVTAQRRQGIRHLPNILLLALRRFDYDFDTMRRVKINDQYEFPWELDLEPYTIEGLHRRDIANEGEQVREHPADYYQYRLRGIVIHMGSAEGGHYYCFIQDRSTSKWLEFNDTLVREVDQGDIPAEAYGGQEQFNVSSVYGDVTEIQEKVSSAYLLLYERSGQYAVRDPTEREIKKTVLSTDVPEGDSTKVLVEGVIERNRKFWSRKTAFAHEFVDFMLQLIQSNSSDLTIVKLAATFFLTVVVRSKDRYSLHQFVPELSAALQNSLLASQWFLEMVSVPEVIQELLLVCPLSFVRRVVVGLAKHALALVDDERKIAALENFLVLLMKAKTSQHFTQYFELIYALARKTQLPAHLKLADRLISFIMGQNFVQLQPSASKSSDAMLGYHSEFQPSEDHFTPVSASKNPSITYALATLAECELTEAQKDIILSKDFFQAMLKLVEGKSGAREAGKLYYELIRDDEVAGRLVLNMLMTSVNEDGKETKRISLKMLAHVLSREGDVLAQERVSMILTELAARMKAASTTRDRSIVEMLGPFVHKLCLHNENACLWVNENWKNFNWLEDWVRRWTYPAYYGADSLDSTISKQLKSLASGRVKADTEDWDSDQDLEFKKDDIVRVYKAITDAYEYVIITDVLGDVARGKVESRDNAIIWVEADSDEARPSKYRSALGSQYKMRRVLEPIGERQAPATREQFGMLTRIDPVSQSVASAKTGLERTYQYFRRAGDGADSFFRGLGVALLEHYCRKTTPLDEFENFRKWVKKQEGATVVRIGAEEEYKSMQTVLTILSEDKREFPGLTLYQLQNLLAYSEFDKVLVVMFRMMVINSLELNAHRLNVSQANLDRYLDEWKTIAADDTFFQAAAYAFDVHMLIEDCYTQRYQSKPFSGSTTQRPFLQLFRYQCGFLVLYKNRVMLIDGFNNGEFNTSDATAEEKRYSAECYYQPTSRQR